MALHDRVVVTNVTVASTNAFERAWTITLETDRYSVARLSDEYTRDALGGPVVKALLAAAGGVPKPTSAGEAVELLKEFLVAGVKEDLEKVRAELVALTNVVIPPEKNRK